MMENDRDDEIQKTDFCSVVASIYCTAAPQSDTKTRARCYSCGEGVCVNCSLRIDYYAHGKQRICHTCIEQRFDQFDPRIYAHLWTLAGYTTEEGYAAAAAARAADAANRGR